MLRRKTEKNYHGLAKRRGFKWIDEMLSINIAINYLVDTNNSLYNLYLEDWKI